MKKDVNIHIGKLIDKKMKERGFTPSELAKEIGCKRTTIYSILNNDNSDVKKLKIIGDILDHNFFTDLANAIGKKGQEKKHLAIVEISEHELERLKQSCSNCIFTVPLNHRSPE